MLDCISVENMRRSDRQTIERFVPSLELMRRAAAGVFQAVSWGGRIAIVAGSGNNGGDGFALACILHEHGMDCAIYTLSDRLSQDSGFYAKQAKEKGVSIRPFQPGRQCLSGYHILVDCLLGTGFQGALRDTYRRAIEEFNASNAYVVSVDINSGMNGDTGEMEITVASDLTVTVGYLKNGLLSECAGKYIKRLVCADIGIVLAKEENKVCDPQEWQALCACAGVAAEEKHLQLSGTNYYPCPAWLDMAVIPVCP